MWFKFLTKFFTLSIISCFDIAKLPSKRALNFSINSTNDILEIDPINNVKAIKEGKTTLEATYDGITGRINVEVFDNPVTSIKLKSKSCETISLKILVSILVDLSLCRPDSIASLFRSCT